MTSVVNYLGNLRTESIHVSSNDRIVTDAPVDNNGKGEAFSPTDLVASSLSSCILTVIGIVSKKNSVLYKASDIKIFIPEVKEAGLGIVPTSSTCEQLAIGDCLAVAALNKKGFNRKNFKTFL